MNTGRMLARMTASWVLVFSALLLLAILTLALPQAGQAQDACRTFHLVREGDTKPSIAQTYGLKWKRIAAANDLNVEAKPAVGSQLCIPEAGSDDGDQTAGQPKTLVDRPEGERRAVIEISINSGRVRIHTDNFNDDHIYLVKARDVNRGAGGWQRLGLIRVEEDESETFSFDVPQALRGEPVLSVCLKDQTTDELICRSLVNP